MYSFEYGFFSCFSTFNDALDEDGMERADSMMNTDTTIDVLLVLFAAHKRDDYYVLRDFFFFFSSSH